MFATLSLQSVKNDTILSVETASAVLPTLSRSLTNLLIAVGNRLMDYCNKTKEILLNRGKFTIVDERDYEWLSQWKWYLDKPQSSGNTYVIREGRHGHKRSLGNAVIFMHREILIYHGFDLEGMCVDHVNRNPLDNRLVNLRVATRLQNACNVGRRKDNVSGYKGVSWDSARRSRFWKAQIAYKGKKFFLGNFSTAEEAARAYDRKAIELHGEFAYTNFPREDYL